jgi:hypothetical protein
MKPKDTEILKTKPSWKPPPEKTVDTPQVAPQTPPGATPAPGQEQAQGPGLTSVPTGLFAPSTLTQAPKTRGQSGKTATHRNPSRTTG